jgi:hypothetical protein
VNKQSRDLAGVHLENSCDVARRKQKCCYWSSTAEESRVVTRKESHHGLDYPEIRVAGGAAAGLSSCATLYHHQERQPAVLGHFTNNKLKGQTEEPGVDIVLPSSDATTGLLDGTVAFSPTGKFLHLHERGRSGEVNANKLDDPEAPSSLSSETSSEDKIPEEVITIWTNAAKALTTYIAVPCFLYVMSISMGLLIAGAAVIHNLPYIGLAMSVGAGLLLVGVLLLLISVCFLVMGCANVARGLRKHALRDQKRKQEERDREEAGAQCDPPPPPPRRSGAGGGRGDQSRQCSAPATEAEFGGSAAAVTRVSRFEVTRVPTADQFHAEDEFEAKRYSTHT